LGVLKFFEGTGDLVCVIATIKTPEGSLQKVVDGTSFSIGRAPDCVLSIPNAGISRLHALVTIKRGEIYLTDQESSNGTFLNGTKIEPKRLIHVKATDEIKLGLSDVILQLAAIEKHFKIDYIAESLLPNAEKDNLMELIKASNHKAQEIIASAQAQADHINQAAAEKARNTENQSLLKQEEIISSAQVEGQHLIAESKRKAAQILMENEDKAKESCQHIYEQADRIRKEAEAYFQNRVQQAEKSGSEIIEHHTKAALDVAEEIKLKAAQKTEAEIRQKLSSVTKDIELKSKILQDLEATCADYESKRKTEIEQEMMLLKEELQAQQIKQKTDFEAQYKREQELGAAVAAKQEQTLDLEIQNQRQQLAKITEDLYTANSMHVEVKTEFDELQAQLKNLKSNEADVVNSLNDKREQFKKAEGDLQTIKQQLDLQNEKFLTEKTSIEKQISDYQTQLNKSKVDFDVNLEKLNLESKKKIAQLEEDYKKTVRALEQQLILDKAEIHKKTTQYIDSEKASMDAYKTQLLQEKKELELAFTNTKKEFESRTNEFL
jgi:pSer/pThr/pTyr-binding forkhead associated (FHA) protein